MDHDAGLGERKANNALIGREPLNFTAIQERAGGIKTIKSGCATAPTSRVVGKLWVSEIGPCVAF